MTKKIVVGITGASGVIYGIRLLEFLKSAGCETHLIISTAGRLNINIETDFSVESVCALADHIYEPEEMAATVASGSFLTDGMVVVPCTIKTLSGIANSFTENLLLRAADVTLKEKRRLVLMVRETPLHRGHLRLMDQAAEMGAVILPPMPSFYHRPKTIDDIINQTIGKICDSLKIKNDLFQRWGNENIDTGPFIV
jgi:flavin prenyltransferase